MDSLFWATFWASVLVFIVIVCIMFVKPFRKLMMPNGFFIVIALLLILGVALLLMTIRNEPAAILKAFLLLTGASAAGLSVFAILHNLVTAMLTKFFKVKTNFDEPVFFILATIVCPLGFLAGAVGTIVLESI